MSGSRLAIIVATDEYDDPSLKELSSPAEDAQALATVLGDPELGEFEVEVLHNRQHQEITMRLETVLTARSPQDVVIVHFSCHGLKDDSGQLYLAAKDTLPTNLWTTAVDATLVNRLIRKSRAGQVVLLLDCCYGGAFERGMVARAAGDVDVGEQFQQDVELGAGRGRAVITASSAMEYAFEGARLSDSAKNPPSVFTSALSEGLRTGDADRGQDGVVDLGELYDYVFDRVRETNPRQTPCKWEYGTQGDLVIARNPNRRIARVPLPDSVQRLVIDPYAPTRVGAVDELRKLAAGTILPLAATARAQVVVMSDPTQEDSDRVRTAAKAVLHDTEVGVSELHVELGTVECDAVVTHVVELTGVPLVDVSRARAEGDGITVHQVGRRVTIELETTEPRVVDASVLIEGPAGQANVTVHAVVLRGATVPQPPPPPTPPPVLPEPPPEPAPEPPPTVGPTQPTPEPSPLDPAVTRRRRARAGAVVLLLGTVASFLTLFPDWTTASPPPGPPGDQPLTWGAVTYLLPLAVVAGCAGLLWLRGSTPVPLGTAAGAAVATLVVMGQQVVRFLYLTDSGPSGWCWIAVVCRLVLVAGVLVAARGMEPDEGRVGLSYGPLRVLAAAVLVAGIVLARIWAVDIQVIKVSLGQMVVFTSAGLVVGLAGSFLVLPVRRRHAFLSAVTTLCTLMALSDLWLFSTWNGHTGNPVPRWQLFDTAVCVLVLAVVWLVQGTAGRREVNDEASPASRPSSAPGP